MGCRMKLIGKISELLNNANAAKRKSGKNLIAQFQEIKSLASAPNLLSPSEYYQFGLYDDSVFNQASKSQFLGYKAQRLYEKLNHPAWHALANDKLAFHSMMQANGFKIPQIFAIFHNGNRLYNHALSLRNGEDIGEFFQRQEHYPLFIKPVHGVFGKGTFLVKAYDQKHQALILNDNKHLPLTAFINALSQYQDEGVIFQEKLEPSEAVRDYCGDRLSSVRLIVLMHKDGPRLFRAAWKIPVDNNIVDNTDGWTNGNIVGVVDRKTGYVSDAFCGTKEKGIHNITHHPNTNSKLTDIQVPHWDELSEYVLKAAPLFYGIGFQGWDVVSTSKGIMSLEVNLVTMSTVLALQLVHRQGFLDSDLKQALNLS